MSPPLVTALARPSPRACDCARYRARVRAGARRVSPSPFPLVLYGVNGVLPVAICLRQGMWWAAGLGALAMAIPLTLAVRAGAPRGARAPSGDRGMYGVPATVD